MWVYILTILATVQCEDIQNNSYNSYNSYSSFNSLSLEDLEGRIVGGTVVEPPHKYPFQVYIYLGGYACGGSIIDTHHVLTACHCLYNYEGVMHKPEETFV